MTRLRLFHIIGISFISALGATLTHASDDTKALAKIPPKREIARCTLANELQAVLAKIESLPYPHQLPVLSTHDKFRKFGPHTALSLATEEDYKWRSPDDFSVIESKPLKKLLMGLDKLYEEQLGAVFTASNNLVRKIEADKQFLASKNAETIASSGDGEILINRPMVADDVKTSFEQAKIRLEQNMAAAKELNNHYYQMNKNWLAERRWLFRHSQNLPKEPHLIKQRFAQLQDEYYSLERERRRAIAELEELEATKPELPDENLNRGLYREADQERLIQEHDQRKHYRTSELGSIIPEIEREQARVSTKALLLSGDEVAKNWLPLCSRSEGRKRSATALISAAAGTCLSLIVAGPLGALAGSSVAVYGLIHNATKQRPVLKNYDLFFRKPLEQRVRDAEKNKELRALPVPKKLLELPSGEKPAPVLMRDD